MASDTQHSLVLPRSRGLAMPVTMSICLNRIRVRRPSALQIIPRRSGELFFYINKENKERRRSKYGAPGNRNSGELLDYAERLIR